MAAAATEAAPVSSNGKVIEQQSGLGQPFGGQQVLKMC
jgi:hypothetical protein